MKDLILHLLAGAACGFPAGYALAWAQQRLKRPAVSARPSLPSRLIAENKGRDSRKAGTADSALPPSYWIRAEDATQDADFYGDWQKGGPGK